MQSQFTISINLFGFKNSLLSKARKGRIKVYHEKAIAPMFNATAISPQVISTYPHLEVITPSYEPRALYLYLFLPSPHYLVWSLFMCIYYHFPFWFTNSLWLRREYDSFLDSLQHLACRLISNYSQIKGQEGCWVWPFWEKEASWKIWPWNRLIGSVWITKGSAYTK